VDDEDIRAHVDAVPGYCNTASIGIPPGWPSRVCVTAWTSGPRGSEDQHGFDADVAAARERFAVLADAPVASVAMPGAVSITSGVVASSLSDGARCCAEEDYTSVLFPFLVDDST
jgi:hypothetical protein